MNHEKVQIFTVIVIFYWRQKMNKNPGKYNFLKIEEIIIRNFSLYTKNNTITNVKEEIKTGVYCLAGANGLGKTTFLNIVNYGLTGIVLKPNNEIFSPEEIIDSNKGYTSRYFEGRIRTKDKKDAEVEIRFSINGKNYRIIRSFFNREELKLLEITKVEKQNKTLIIDTSNLGPTAIKEEYEINIANDVGIGKFEYFIFFQLYVLSFDEHRRLLFWDDRASTNTLSIAFNYSLSDTDRILELKQIMDKAESDGRNARWQATQIRQKKENLLLTKKEKELRNWDQLKKEYDMSVLKVEETQSLFNNIETEYDTLLKRQNIINSEILQLKTKYKKLFSQYSEPRSKLLNSQYVQYSKKENKCFLCGSSGHYVVNNIEKNVHNDKCPICNTIIDEGKGNEQIELLRQLEAIDKQIDKKTTELDSLILESDAKKVELEKAEYEYYSAKEHLKRFEKENTNIIFEKSGNKPIDDLIKEYQNQFDRFDKESKDCYKKRDKLRPEYDKLIASVNSAYKEAEEVFVPLFKQFAKSFIGLDLNIYFKKKGKDIVLNFELLGTARTESFQLSESQRYFLDIALRMTLAVYLSKPGEEATLIIDTPEGSLDIAYESRAGDMFANFVIEYNQHIVMTANINASQLLISLANKCSNKRMQFRRMLEWTDLTVIQKEGEHLFEKVYENIENALKGK